MICLFCLILKHALQNLLSITVLPNWFRGLRASIIYLIYYSLTTLSLCLTFRSYSSLAPATTVQLPGKHVSCTILALKARVTSILVMLIMLVLIFIFIQLTGFSYLLVLRLVMLIPSGCCLKKLSLMLLLCLYPRAVICEGLAIVTKDLFILLTLGVLCT